MSRKKAAIGKASPISRPGIMYDAGEPSSQTQRKETTANEGMIVMIRIILESPSLLEIHSEYRHGVHTVSALLGLKIGRHV